MTEVPLEVITPNDVRASVRRAKKSLEKAAEEIVWQIEREAWRTLGYKSWDAMRQAEYGGAAVILPTKVRPEIVRKLKEIPVGKTARGKDKHLTDKEVAETLGVSTSQVSNDLGVRDKSCKNAKNVTPDDGGERDPGEELRHEMADALNLLRMDAFTREALTTRWNAGGRKMLRDTLVEAIELIDQLEREGIQ